ncbi:hypothetical protein E2C01_013771 [Portunus trituberculatus]|uniref:Uncharacterized protein n=1 Tax=Portunus trituberculatus TaxID=210409 RepID=A0A5B7DH48_PORTR|nr:hypothetical protein [Portunus trituberculatus]
MLHDVMLYGLFRSLSASWRQASAVKQFSLNITRIRNIQLNVAQVFGGLLVDDMLAVELSQACQPEGSTNQLGEEGSAQTCRPDCATGPLCRAAQINSRRAAAVVLTWRLAALLSP